MLHHFQDIKTEVNTENGFIEFEFTPGESSPTKERSISPEPEDVVDTIYAAAARGDHSKVCDLIYAKGGTADSLKGGKGLDGTFEANLKIFETRARKRKNNQYRHTLPCPTKKVAKEEFRPVEFTNIVNTRGANLSHVQKLKPEDPKSQDGKLIDYTVLTKALSKTLESKLKEGDNELKIVIFCNNKPIQSFSVKSNQKAAKKNLDVEQKASDASCDKTSPSKPLFNLFENKPTCPSPDLNTDRVVKQEIDTTASVSSVPSLASVPAVSVAAPKVITSAANPELNNIVASLPGLVPVSIFHNSNGATIPIFSRGQVPPSLLKSNAPGILGSHQQPVFTTAAGHLIASTAGVSIPSTGVNLNSGLLAGTHILPKGSNPFAHLPNGPFLATTGRSGELIVTPNLFGVPASGFQTDLKDKETTKDSVAKEHNRFVITNVKGSAHVEAWNDVDENCNGLAVTCNQCNKTFKQKRYLNRHKIRVHGVTSDKPSSTTAVNAKLANCKKPMVKEVIKKDIRIDSDQIERLLGQKFVDIAELVEKTSIAAEKNFESVKVDMRDIKCEDDDSSDETRLAREASAESEDSVTKYISSIIDDDLVLEEVNFADRGKRALYHKTSNELKGESAKNILCNAEKGKPVRLYRTESGMPMRSDGVIEPVYVCEECGKFYRARKTLKDHYLREHAQSKEDEPLYLYITGNKYQCPICFNNFHSGSELVAHTKKHTGELQIPCKLCGKVYSSVHVLRRHIEHIHTELRPRPFQCELCDYAASNKWHLKEHYRRHTGGYSQYKWCL